MSDKDYIEGSYNPQRRQVYLPPDIDLKSLKPKFKDVYQQRRVKGDLLFIPFADGRVECHSLSTNVCHWSNDLSGIAGKPQYTISDMQMRIHGDDLLVVLQHVVYVLDIHTGHIKQQIGSFSGRLDEYVICGDMLFYRITEDKSYYLAALSLSANRFVWKSPTPLENGLTAMVMYGDKLIIRSGFDRRLIAYNKHTGQEYWRIDASLFESDEERKLSFHGNPLVMDDLLVTSLPDGHVVCFNIITAEVAWIVNVGDRAVRRLSCDPDGAIYVACNFVVYCINIYTGKIKKMLGKSKLKKVFQHDLFLPAFITENQLILFSAFMDPLVAINRKTGIVEQSVNLKHRALPDPFTAADRLFLRDKKYNLYISKPAK